LFLYIIHTNISDATKNKNTIALKGEKREREIIPLTA
jgi:hypothetical protein